MTRLPQARSRLNTVRSSLTGQTVLIIVLALVFSIGLMAAYFGDNVRPTCYLQLGYNPETRMIAKIKEIRIVDGKTTDLAIDKPVYAIHLENVEKLVPTL